MKNSLSSIVFFLFVFLVFASCNSTNPIVEDGLKYTNYEESDSIFINPERGFYSQIDYHTSKLSNPLTVTAVKGQRAVGHSIILTMYYLDSFKDKSLSTEFLAFFAANMKAIRDGGAKCILRFAYSDAESAKPWDATQNIVLEHIQQLAPYLKENKDVIYVMQAGFVGVWGEWYYTSNFVMSPVSSSDYAPRRAVLDALLQALPADRMICLRTPMFKLKCFNIGYSDTLTAGSAYKETALSRIACHNDCFLADASDMGTFGSNLQMSFWQQESRYTAMGGETCQPSSYSDCLNAMTQMEKYHWSYLNSGYHGTVLNDWRVNGCIETINKKLGYRFVLVNGKFTDKPVSGKEFTTTLTIKNVGFAAPFNPRTAEFIFVAENDPLDKQTISIDVDPRSWNPGTTQTISLSYTLPSTMKGKRYTLFLNLPDKSESLNQRPEYSIRLANLKVWNSVNGYNKLTSIAVQ